MESRKLYIPRKRRPYYQRRQISRLSPSRTVHRKLY